MIFYETKCDVILPKSHQATCSGKGKAFGAWSHRECKGRWLRITLAIHRRPNLSSHAWMFHLVTSVPHVQRTETSPLHSPQNHHLVECHSGDVALGQTLTLKGSFHHVAHTLIPRVPLTCSQSASSATHAPSPHSHCLPCHSNSHLPPCSLHLNFLPTSLHTCSSPFSFCCSD